MNLKAKILLLAILPLLSAAGILSYLGLTHAHSLATQILGVYEQNLIESKKQALKEQVELAFSAIEHVRRNEALSEEEAKSEVIALLSRMTFGEDGYFFAYDQQGINLVHPTIPAFVGQNLFEFEDRSGNLLIQHLLNAANTGGGYHRYIWERPPLMQQEDKLGYAMLIPDWEWMFGTGLYLDTIYADISQVKQAIDDNIRNSFLTVMLVLLFTVILIVILGLAINLHEHRLADDRLRQLVKKFMRLQVNERRRFSRELHDGINQQLVSMKFRIELACKKLENQTPEHPAIDDLQKTEKILNQTIREVRQISHSLRPVLLDDLGLESALKGLLDQFSERTSIQVKLEYELCKVDLPDDVGTTLYRLAQECLTNIEKHADASHVKLRLYSADKEIHFEVFDNGKGFNLKTAQHKGIGLVNMKERVEVIGGRFVLHSEINNGAHIMASLPCK